MKKHYSRNFKWIFVFIIQFALSSCAIGQTMVNHHFSFDTISDHSDAEVLDYQYGSSRQFGTHADKERVQLGQVFPAWNTYGAMPRGDVLYVKWRIKQSGEIYEDRVDLKTRLPADITNWRIHFAIKGPQLYVYLISPEKRSASSPAGPLKMYADLKQSQIYPDQTK
jgi:hypothetical protein